MDAQPRRWTIVQILVLSTNPLTEGSLLNQIPFDGTRREAEIWADASRIVAASNGYDTDFEFRFITE